MSYEQIGKILQIINKCHEQVRHSCLAREFDFTDEQQQLLIATIQEDQRRLQVASGQYQENSNHSGSIASWIQYVPQGELEASVKHIVEMQSPTFDGLMEAIGNFYQAIEHFINRIKEQAPSKNAVRILDDLGALEKQNAKALTERLAGLQDV